MKQIFTIFSLIALWGFTPPLNAKDTCRMQRTIIGQVNVITDDQTLVTSVFVEIDRRDGTISSMHSGFPPGEDPCDIYIDGTGKYLVPGLVEMHGHLPDARWPKGHDRDTMFLYLSAGVTTVRGMLGDPIQFDLRKKIMAGDMDGPTLYLAAPSLNGSTVSSVDQARQLVQRYKKEGWDLLKIHPGLSLDEYKAIAEEAKKLSLHLGGHVPEDVGLLEVLKARQHTIDHMDGYLALYLKDPKAFDQAQIINYTQASHTTIVPTQVLFNMLRSGADLDSLLSRDENKYVPKATLNRWADRVKKAKDAGDKSHAPWRNAMLKALADAGVPIALGSDSPQIFSVPGFAIWRELDLMAEIGLTPKQLLKAAGPTPGQMMAYTGDKFGSIEVGYRADLLLLSENPLENPAALKKQEAVIVRGKLYWQSDIQKRLQAIEKRIQAEK